MYLKVINDWVNNIFYLFILKHIIFLLYIYIIIFSNSKKNKFQEKQIDILLTILLY